MESKKVYPPEKLYLQFYGDSDDAEGGIPDPGDMDITWCREKIFDHDLEYVRASGVDLAKLVSEWKPIVLAQKKAQLKAMKREKDRRSENAARFNNSDVIAIDAIRELTKEIRTIQSLPNAEVWDGENKAGTREKASSPFPSPSCSRLPESPRNIEPTNE